jgi:hypothetical protein
MPAGFMLNVVKSPPNAANAPPMAVKRAVPSYWVWERSNPSHALWAFATPVTPMVNMNKSALFISYLLLDDPLLPLLLLLLLLPLLLLLLTLEEEEVLLELLL